MKRFVLIIRLVGLFNFLAAQQSQQEIVQVLSEKGDNQIILFCDMLHSIEKLDSVKRVNLMTVIEKGIHKKPLRIQSGFYALKARVLYYLPSGTFHEDTSQIKWMAKALSMAYQLDDPFRIAAYNRYYGEMLLDKNLHAEGLQYCLKAMSYMEELGLEYFKDVQSFYLTIGELFFRVKEYKLSIQFLQKGFDYKVDTLPDYNVYALEMNTLGLAYRNINRFDSSLAVLSRCMHYCDSLKIPNWYAFAHDNRFDAFLAMGKLDSCKKIADVAYTDGMTDTAAGILMVAYWQYGAIAIKKQNWIEAIGFLQKSEYFRKQVDGYSELDVRLYRDLSVVYDSLHQSDRALRFYKLFQDARKIEDDKTKVVYDNYLLEKANFERKDLQLKQNRKARMRDVHIRNYGILGIVLIAGLIIYFIDKKRRRAQLEKQLAIQKLDQFIENIVQKDEEIDKLQNNIQAAGQSAETQDYVRNLSSKIILTEQDWIEFQELFEKAYPGYIFRVKVKTPQITEAELRLALLLKIKLNNKQIAAMQGISIDTVHKTKQRLRNRFSTPTSQELEIILSEI